MCVFCSTSRMARPSLSTDRLSFLTAWLRPYRTSRFATSSNTAGPLCGNPPAAEIGFAHLRVVLHAGCRPVIDHAAEVQDHCAVAKIVHERHVVLDDKERQPFPGDRLE